MQKVKPLVQPTPLKKGPVPTQKQNAKLEKKQEKRIESSEGNPSYLNK